MLPFLSANVPADLQTVPAPIAGIGQDAEPVGSGWLTPNVAVAKFIKPEKPASAVFLSDPPIAEPDLMSARRLYADGREVRAASLFMPGEDHERIVSATIAADVDAAALSAVARHAVSGGNASVSTFNGAVVRNRKARSKSGAARPGDIVAVLLGDNSSIVNQRDTGARAQVSLQVRIATVSRSISEDPGNGLSASTGDFTAPQRSGGSCLGSGCGFGDFNRLPDAWSQNRFAAILSAPDLTTRSGEAAKFPAGGRLLFPVRAYSNLDACQPEPIGVKLEFVQTAQIRPEPASNMRDTDRAGAGNADAPALNQRSATTTSGPGSGIEQAVTGKMIRRIRPGTRISLRSRRGGFSLQ